MTKDNAHSYSAKKKKMKKRVVKQPKCPYCGLRCGDACAEIGL